MMPLQGPAAMRLRSVAFILVLAGTPAGVPAVEVPVDDVDGLRAAIQAATPGDEIVLATGTYDIAGNLVAATPGLPTVPIVVRAAQSRGALLRFSAPGSVVEGFRLLAPW